LDRTYEELKLIGREIVNQYVEGLDRTYEELKHNRFVENLIGDEGLDRTYEELKHGSEYHGKILYKVWIVPMRN